jgi:Na+/proline symporter
VTLHIADICVLVLYLVIVTAIGLRAAKRIKTSADFFMPRKFGKVMMLFFAFGSGTHSDQAVGVASKSFTNGLSGIWYQWLYLPTTPFYWLIAPVLRRFRAITTADVFEARFSRSVATLFVVVGIMTLVVSLALMLRGSSEVISASIGGMVPPRYAMAIMAVLFMGYGFAGGLAAAVLSDFLQGILTVVFSFLLLPLILNAVGGLDGIRHAVGDRHVLSLVVPGDIGLFYIAVISFTSLVGIVTQPHILGNCAAGKTEFEGQVGFMGGMILKRLCTIPWALTGVAAIVYFAGRDIHPDQVFGAVAGDFLPKLVPGVLGVFIAAVLASVMSSCSAFMISSSALFTENIYRRVLPDKPAGHYVLVGRLASVVFVAAGVIIAFWLPNIVKGLEIFWMTSPVIGIAFWLGFFWRRTTVAGAWAATLTAAAVWWLTTQSFFVNFLCGLAANENMRFVVSKGAGLSTSLPWQMVFYLTAGTLAGIIVSLFTKPVAAEKLDNFYALIRTPVKAGEEVTAPCTLPAGTVVPVKRCIFDKGGIEILVPSVTSVVGFTIGLFCAVALIGLVFLITRL